MSETRTILVVTKDDGTIIGAAFPAVPDKDGNSTGIEARPGQTIRRVELPERLCRLRSSGEVLRGLRDYCFPPGAASLERSDAPPTETQSSLSTD